jgi:hypothetical protein
MNRLAGSYLRKLFITLLSPSGILYSKTKFSYQRKQLIQLRKLFPKTENSTRVFAQSADDFTITSNLNATFEAKLMEIFIDKLMTNQR